MKGPRMFMLHGWMDSSATFQFMVVAFSNAWHVIAPDLRGFGDSDKPDGLFGPDQQAADMQALMDALDLDKAGVVGHDVGGALMQPLARNAAERLAGLFFFDFVYPGIGHIPMEETADRSAGDVAAFLGGLPGA